MKRFAKILLAVVMTAAMGVSAVACGGGGSSDGRTEIRFWYSASISENTIIKEMVDAYNNGQGKEDGVHVTPNNRQNIERTSLYKNAPNVIAVSDEDFKSWAVEGLFYDMSEFYESDPGTYTEEGIPETLTERFRIDKEVGSDGKRMAGEGADLQGVPFGANTMVYYYSLYAFEKQGINIISVAEDELDTYNEQNGTNIMPHGYAEYKKSPYEGAVSSKNLAGDTVYKVFNNCISMNWEEFRYISKMFTQSYNNSSSPTEKGSATHWWFSYGWSVGGDCIGYDGEKYEFTAADKEPNWLVLEDIELNGNSYSAGDIVSYEDRGSITDEIKDSLHELPSQYDALYEFVCLSSPTDGNGGKGEKGYSVGIYSDDNTPGSLVQGDVALLASDNDALTSFETSYKGKYDIAPAQQWREYVGGSVYYEGSESFANEYLKVIGETYDGTMYTGELAKDEETGTPYVGRVTSFSGADALVIPKNSDSAAYEAVWKFIRWAASEEGQSYLLQTGTIPNQTELAFGAEYTETVGAGRNFWAFAYMTQDSNIGDWAYFEDGEWVNDWSGDFNGQLRAGYQTIEAFMERRGAAANKAIGEVNIYLNGRW